MLTACAVRRWIAHLQLRFGWSFMDEEEARPLFPLTDAAELRGSSSWTPGRRYRHTTRTPPTGHGPRRSGAKRYAPMCWAVWMIQFMGRWAASTVLEYIKEAMVEMTKHSRGTGTATWKATGRAVCLAQQ